MFINKEKSELLWLTIFLQCSECCKTFLRWNWRLGATETGVNRRESLEENKSVLNTFLLITYLYDNSHWRIISKTKKGIFGNRPVVLQKNDENIQYERRYFRGKLKENMNLYLESERNLLFEGHTDTDAEQEFSS